MVLASGGCFERGADRFQIIIAESRGIAFELMARTGHQGEITAFQRGVQFFNVVSAPLKILSLQRLGNLRN
jgi:hypothetical protein